MAFECLILGDSIAVGTHQYSKDKCEVVAQVGINSKNYYKKYISSIGDANRYVISLGANDYADTYKWIKALRDELPTGSEVTWIVPANNNEAKKDIIFLTKHYTQDKIVFVDNYPMSKDHVHPTTRGYKEIANTVLK